MLACGCQYVNESQLTGGESAKAGTLNHPIYNGAKAFRILGPVPYS